MDDRNPETQPSGALVPPPQVPPGALVTSAPPPPPPSREPTITLSTRGLRDLVNAALDELDSLGDRIADAAGLR